MTGKVYITGVGPGDHKLITLKAMECIAKSDVIVYDRLISNKILSYAKDDAELIYVGKMPDCHVVPQDSINEILVKKALEGKKVARVKGGDPFLFGRGGEEAEALLEKGIEFEIIPGVTSALAVPAYAGIPVTHRDYCSSLHIITGHERHEKDNSIIDFETIAKLTGTLVFLMGVKNLAEICSNLIKYGKSDTTPVAVIEKGTTIEQRVARGVLKDIYKKVSDIGIKSPAITVIGDVTNLHEKLKWFPSGKLAGKRVLVTRSRVQASKLVEQIEELGAEAVEFPTIKIEPPLDYSYFDMVLERLGKYKWIVFTSVTGVKLFFERMRMRCFDIRNLFGVKICAVGKATSDEVNRFGLNVDYIPDIFTTGELLKGLWGQVQKSDKVLLARSDIANIELSKGLKENGNEVDDLVVYRTLADTGYKDDVIGLLREGKIDFITFTSSSTVNNFVSIIGKEKLELLKKVKVVCIGPVTKDTAIEHGICVTAVADVHTIDGLVKKLVEIVG
jgi:uroporphyrinogen III methyltransferase / synthase